MIRLGLLLVCLFVYHQDVMGQSDCRRIRRRCPYSTRRSPVCDTNGRTWNSHCALLRAQCNDPYLYVQLAYSGKCIDQQMRRRQPIYQGSAASATSSSEESAEMIGPTVPAIGRTTIKPANNPTLAPDGVMPYPCPLQCAPSTKQVCGSDGYTYDSVCHMRMEACRTRDRSLIVNYSGPCQCPDVCPMVYEPVCAVSRRLGFPRERTFTSVCEMQKDACRHSDRSMTMSYQGECLTALQGTHSKDNATFRVTRSMSLCAVPRT
ncbi:agrin-like [Strongylocentrotus purpuratus]|uniref:Kazal-like domain-containing protein n=1 Tax=Strongylocentrotus purpuratus TaxID=7668 RepID=A0A7M7MYU6_STRPU|nr:agrin-like [Strongylocentrotus purpuratus]